MKSVIHFEIECEDVERGIKFYQAVFGWQIDKWDGEFDYWMVTTKKDDEPGINGGLSIRDGVKPEEGRGINAFACTITVDDFDLIQEKILKAGGRVRSPKKPLIGMAWVGDFIDTEGNRFGIYQPDENAK